MPFPKEETTPPVMNTYLAIILPSQLEPIFPARLTGLLIGTGAFAPNSSDTVVSRVARFGSELVIRCEIDAADGPI